jgi:hypothetical protein
MDERTETMTATFSERDWATRKGGDFFYHSESMFEAEWPGPASHFGLGEDTEGMATYKMSPFVSHAPDYIAALTETSQPVFVEVQGTGMGGATEGVLSHKFKQKKLDNLQKWNTYDEVTFWLWEDFSKTHIWTSYASVRMMINQGQGVTAGSFDGKRPYWAIELEVMIAKADTERLMEKYG